MKAYISCPLTVSTDVINHASDILKARGYEPCYYKRGTTYSDTQLVDSNIFVLISEHNSFMYNILSMTRGCKSELEKAIEMKKSIYIFYKSTKHTEIYCASASKLLIGVVHGVSKSYLPKISTTIINNYQIY